MNKPIEKALAKIHNRFLLTTVVARRWENLVAGSPALAEEDESGSKINTVLREIIAERVTVNEEELMIEVVGAPEEEEVSETLFTEGFVPDANGVKEHIKDE